MIDTKDRIKKLVEAAEARIKVTLNMPNKFDDEIKKLRKVEDAHIKRVIEQNKNLQKQLIKSLFLKIG